MTWQEVRDDPILQRLPYRKELSKWGNVLMSPIPPAHHAGQVARISGLLGDLRKGGRVLIDAAVDTAEKTKLVDVAWISSARGSADPSSGTYVVAPEICVEVLAPGDFLEEYRLRGQLYLQAGAQEFWLCNELGDMRFCDAKASLAHSRLCPEFPARIEFRR